LAPRARSQRCYIFYDEIERFTASSLLCACAIQYSCSGGRMNNENEIFILAKQVSISLYKCRTDRRAEGFLHLTSIVSYLGHRVVANECPPLVLRVNNMVNRLRKSHVSAKRSTCGSDRGEKHERAAHPDKYNNTVSWVQIPFFP
jgi:hypothetical protein